jgi:short-subunit dehydrogenase
VLGRLSAEPTVGLYNASKWALEGLMEALSREVEHLGIKVSIVEPGPYATEFGSDASLKRSPQIAANDEAAQAARQIRSRRHRRSRGNARGDLPARGRGRTAAPSHAREERAGHHPRLTL